MEGSVRRRASRNGLEGDLADDERTSATPILGLAERRRASPTVEESQDQSAKEAEQGRLHRGKGLATALSTTVSATALFQDQKLAALDVGRLAR